MGLIVMLDNSSILLLFGWVCPSFRGRLVKLGYCFYTILLFIKTSHRSCAYSGLFDAFNSDSDQIHIFEILDVIIF